jgi:Zn-dependent M28 family amino/carboxypeptidase
MDYGSGRIRGVYLQENEALRPIFRPWLAPFTDLGASTLSLRGVYGSDQRSFDVVGLPGISFIQDELDYETRTHHTSQDLLERVNPEDLAQAAAILAAFVYQTAMRDERLPRKPVASPAR